jgi:LAO/AO transport system kinase
MEMADLIAINKADGNNIDKAEGAKVQYRNALHLFPQKDSGWIPDVLTCSAYHKKGIKGIWEKIERFKKLTMESGYFHRKRNEQSTFWMHETIESQLKRGFYNHPEVKEKIKLLENYVLNNQMSSFVAASELMRFYAKLK